MHITYGRAGFELNANLLDSHSSRQALRCLLTDHVIQLIIKAI